MPRSTPYIQGMAKRKPRGVIESILGNNLDALMVYRKELSTNHKVANKIKIPARTVGRIRNAESSCSIDTLAKLARAFSIEPWHLLIPNYDPANPPVRTMTQAERNLYASMRRAAQQLDIKEEQEET